MKYILLLAVLTACGNPHISTNGSKADKVTPPITQDECSPDLPNFTGQKFFFGTVVDAEFTAFLTCRNVITETFVPFNDGTVPELNNADRENHSYTVTHRTEINHDPDKVETVEDIFGDTTYDFAVETPVSYNGSTGVDRGIDSGSPSSSKDAFLWSFSSPITFWSANVVGLKVGAKLRLFDCARELIRTSDVTTTSTIISFISAEADICHVSLSAADGSESVAVDRFSYGR